MAEVYRDRKMLKWLPFQALPEQMPSLQAIFDRDHKVEKPTFEDDHYEALHYRFTEAWMLHESVCVTYVEDGQKKVCEGTIEGVDPQLKMCMIGPIHIFLDDIIEII
jgi:hypothetical protein